MAQRGAPFGDVSTLSGLATNPPPNYSPSNPYANFKHGWQTLTGFDCSGPGISPGDVALAFLCPCFAAAEAKSRADGTPCCLNLLCWPTPVGVLSYLNNLYLLHQNNECCMGFLCPCCAMRTALAEVNLRGRCPGYEDARHHMKAAPDDKSRQWSTGLCGCSCWCECVETFLCCCYISHEIRRKIHPDQGNSCLTDTFCVLPTAMYSAVRLKYEIGERSGSEIFLQDFVIALLCFPCALMRARREVNIRTGTRSETCKFFQETVDEIIDGDGECHFSEEAKSQLRLKKQKERIEARFKGMR